MGNNSALYLNNASNSLLAVAQTLNQFSNFVITGDTVLRSGAGLPIPRSRDPTLWEGPVYLFVWGAPSRPAAGSRSRARIAAPTPGRKVAFGRGIMVGTMSDCEVASSFGSPRRTSPGPARRSDSELQPRSKSRAAGSDSENRPIRRVGTVGVRGRSVARRLDGRRVAGSPPAVRVRVR